MWAMEVSPSSRESREGVEGGHGGPSKEQPAWFPDRWLCHTVTDILSSLLPCPLVPALNFLHQDFCIPASNVEEFGSSLKS